MNLINKILMCGLVLGMVTVTTQAASAAETSKGNSVIFRIENIKPIQNEEGMISQCEFVLTAYNRLNTGIKEAVIDLSIADYISDKYKVVNGEIKAERNRENAKSVVTKSVEIKDLAPHQQKSFNEVINTEKCFLLLDDLSYKVSSCLAEGEEFQFKNNKRVNSGSCVGAFEYINSQNPEYYSEFSDVPESELQRIAESQKSEDMQIIEDMYKNSIETIQNAAKKLEDIK